MQAEMHTSMEFVMCFADLLSTPIGDVNHRLAQ